MWIEQPEFRAPIPIYQEGGSVRLVTTHLLPDGTGDAQASMQLFVTRPGDTQAKEHRVTQEGASFVAVVILYVPGLWKYKFKSSSPLFVVEERAFHAVKRLVPPPPP